MKKVKQKRDLQILTVKQENFCVEYARTSRPAESYKSAFDTKTKNEGTVSRSATTLLAKPQIAARIIELRQKASEELQFKVNDVLSHWVQIATADVNKLVQSRRTCCRHCWGVNYQYQWTEMEYAMACAKAYDDRKPNPLCEGGLGFNATLDPTPTCQVCFGEGVEGIYVADTRKLTGAERLLYAGIKKTRDGIQVLMRDQDDALRNIAKFLGMCKHKVEVSGSDGGPIPILSTITNDPVEAAKIYQKYMSEN